MRPWPWWWQRVKTTRPGCVGGHRRSSGNSPGEGSLRGVVLRRLGIGPGIAGFAALRQGPAAFSALGLVASAPPLPGAVAIQIDDFTHRTLPPRPRFASARPASPPPRPLAPLPPPGPPQSPTPPTPHPPTTAPPPPPP